MGKFKLSLITAVIDLILFFIFFTCTSASVVNSDPKTFVNNDLKLKGAILKSHKGKEFFAFRGIPYAKPPLGEKRFKDPEPYGEWDDILDVTKDGDICPQKENDLNELGDLKMSEDCLTLNVYTSAMEGNKTVFAFIHGGGLRYGTGHSYHYPPEFILDEDVVLVTFNYRLGPLGFLSTDNKIATGSYGLKDQVLALKWIQNNIQHFGGNPNSVTLIGHSAGSMSVTLHMVSPMPKSLFHRVVALSGAATNQWPLYNVNLTTTLAQSVKCPIDDNSKMIKCLREKPWEDFITVGATWDENEMPDMDWNLELEKDYGQERFLTEHPSVLFKKGEFYKVPIITGITKDEFLDRGRKAISKTDLLNEMDKDFNAVAPAIFGYLPAGTDKANHISEKLREVYFENKPIGKSSEKGIGDLVSDGLINFGVHRFVELARKYVDVYYFQFDYKGKYTCCMTDSDGKPLYVEHSDVLMYLFGFGVCTDELDYVDGDLKMQKKFTKYIINLSNFGDPNGEEDESICTTKWLPSDKENMRVFYIDETCKVGEEFYRDRYAILDELFPINENLNSL